MIAATGAVERAMALMEWTPQMYIGVQEIDAEHKKLVLLINQLFEAMQKGAGHSALGQILQGLISYTRTHFAHEEKLFAETGYPGAEAHKKEHENLTHRVLEIQKRYENGADDTLTIETLTFLKNWLVNHTTGSDKQYAPHLHAHGIE
jgi:hemerythrin